MVVAVNARFWVNDQLEGYGHFTKEVFTRIALQQPGHLFFFLFDRANQAMHSLPSNVTPLVISPAARHPLLWKYWFDFKIPSLLKRIKADVFVSPDAFCSLRTTVPQCMVVHDLGFRHYPQFYVRSHALFYRYYTKRFLQKAKVVATVSEFSKRDIIDQFAIAPDKVDVVFNGVREVFHPLPADLKEKIREKYTEGNEFFFYTGSIHPRKNLLNLLRAFSIFKKRLRSSLKLVLCGRLAWKNEGFLDLLKTYKYRNDVVLTGYLPDAELAALTGAAYAVVYPSLFEGFGVPVLEAMQAGVPPLTSQNSPMEEIAGGAALYFDPQDPKSIAEQLMRIYKDEPLRNQLITSGKQKASLYNWDKSAALLWASIRKATEA